ncbi:NAD(P)/FAD-dependent oxidoreductase [Ramlibacter tataouinensis]|uniref:NAD/FAD-binding protein-like protein n=1 Tax=Ramlibacter tataouinensis (strain ATCC BAA-407 / DSM 14655 / LMG 21543 / TTB310) TaxID=365046 RepID=F5Y264_RAMTT|nr:NAD/FAD-binding protein [Ramlibacter tataouinensis]AEG94832.1 NAD/FAD-binding protein-like protein [Ramlibacter tataouinensis TTB310]
MKVAVVGSGISGLAVCHQLRGRADLTLFEAGAWFGGHAHTVDVTLPDAQGRAVTHGVDTGFLVFNERTYPQLIALFEQLGIATAPSDMSFSVQVPQAFGERGLEWSGSDLNTVFAQRANLLRPRFWRMLRDLLRFNQLATRIAEADHEAELLQPLGDFLDAHGFSREFRHWYFLPMLGCIWSCPTDQMLRFPVATMIRFCHNHGLIQVANRPRWWTVAGGARRYVDKIVANVADARLNTPVRALRRAADGVQLRTDAGWEQFDQVVLATHSDQALALLADADAAEREVLSAIRYQPNRAVLHTDVSVLPQRRMAWSAWNYERGPGADQEARVCLHYLLNMLQPLPWEQPMLVSLNPVREIAAHRVVGEWDYAHPVFDVAAIRAQSQVPQLQGRRRTWFAGAWMGYGFHEDGLKAGLGVARQLMVEIARARMGMSDPAPLEPAL